MEVIAQNEGMHILVTVTATVEVIAQNEGMHILVTVTAITISFHNFLEENALLPPHPFPDGDTHGITIEHSSVENLTLCH